MRRILLVALLTALALYAAPLHAGEPVGPPIVTWEHDGSGTSFKIERSRSGASAFALVTSVPGTSRTYTDTGITSDAIYCYRLLASNAAGDSPYSEVACWPKPSSPTSLRASQGFALSWTDTASLEDQFVIERRSASQAGAFTQIATVQANITTKKDSSASPDSVYCYRVKSTNLAGSSTAYTNEACWPLPTVPSKLTIE